MESSFLQIWELKKIKKILQLIKNNVSSDEIMEETYKLNLTEKELSLLTILLPSIKSGNIEVLDEILNAKVNRRR